MSAEEIEEIEIEVEGHDEKPSSGIYPAVVVPQPVGQVVDEVEEIDAEVEEVEEIPAPQPTAPPPQTQPYAEESMAIQSFEDAQASEQRIQESFKNRIQGSRREEDDSQIAFGEKFCEKFGGVGTMPMPSAPPLTPEVEEQQCRWARATQQERKSFPNHEQMVKFFKTNGMENRTLDPYIKIDAIPTDSYTTVFTERIALARADPATRALNPKEGTPAAAIRSLLYGVAPPIDYATVGDIYLPPSLLAQADLDANRAESMLLQNDQFDQVQIMVNEAAQVYKSSWVWGERVQGGTLEVRMDAERSKIVVLGEGYKKLNMGGLEGWKTVARGIPKDTEYAHVKDEFTIVRIYPGYLGLVQKIGASRTIMRLLPGRYVLPERSVRYIGKAKVVPGENVRFVEHPDSADPDIRQLARRYTLYYLPFGKRLFVSYRDGVFVLDPDPGKRPFIFDVKAMEEPLNCVNPRDFLQGSSDKRYWIVRLQRGQRTVIRDSSGTDIVLSYVEKPGNQASEYNTYHLSKVYYDYDGKVYNRNHQIVTTESVTSVRLNGNHILVLKDNNGNIRFLDTLDPKDTLMLRPPWEAIDVINKVDNLYLYNKDGLTVARVRPASNQWPLIYDVNAGCVQTLPHSMEYIISSQEGQIFIGMADKNGREPQHFDVPGVGRVSIATVRSGQLAMCRLNNMSFFLPPMPEPYVFRPPNEYFGMVDMDNTHVHIPESDLHRIYVPAGQWAVAMIDGRQVILDPASTSNSSDEGEGNGIWIFRAQQLQLAGPKPIDAKLTELFNVTRLQVPMNEIAFGVDSTTGDRLIWGPGNHTINKNNGHVFQGFFRTQLEDVKIENFDVVWNGGVRSTVDACVGFHIVSTGDANDQADEGMMRQVLNLCQNHEDLHNKVVENTKHQLFDVISQIEPLGYGSTMYDDPKKDDEKKGVASLQDLEKMFSEHVELILRKYGIVVDNVTITKINLDPVFIRNSEEVQQARLEARQKVLVAEQELQRNRILQQQALQDQQALTRQQEEESKQRDIERKRESDDTAAAAEAMARAEANKKRVAYEAELARAEAEALSKVKQQETKILELEQKRKATEVEMKTRRDTALLEAETQAIEKSAHARAEAQARMDIAELTLAATKFEVEAQKLKAQGDREAGLAKCAIDLNNTYGGIEQNPELLLELLKLRASVEGQKAIAEATARCTDPAISRMMGRLETFEDVTPKLAMGMGMGSPFMAMPTRQHTSEAPSTKQ